MAELAVTAFYEHFFRFGKKADWDTDVGSNIYQPLAIVSEGIKGDIGERKADVMAGKISRLDQHRRQGLKGAQGPFKAYLCTTNSADLMEMAFGKISSLTALFDQATELMLYNFEIDKGPDVHRAINCRPTSAHISSEQDSSGLMIDFSILGQSFVSGTTLTATSKTLYTGPIFQHYELVLTINGTAYYPSAFEITIDHGLDANIFRTSQTRLAMKRGRRNVTGIITVDYNAATKALLDLWQADSQFGFSAKWTNSTASLDLQTSTPGSVGARFTGEVPEFSGEETAVPLKLPFTCQSTAAGDDELKAVCDIT